MITRLAKAASASAWYLYGGVFGRSCPQEYLHRRLVGGEGGPHREDVVHVSGPVFLEPEWGYVISPSGRLIMDALTPNVAHTKAPWRIATPSLARFAQARRHQRDIMHIESAITLRHWWEWNYYHFYIDVLGKLAILDAFVPEGTPFVLGPYAAELKFAKEAISMSSLAGRAVVQPRDRFILVDNLYYCHLPRAYRHKGEYITLRMDYERQPKEAGRIYLSRPLGQTRRLTNEESILRILKAYQFRTVDASALPLRDQARLFSSVRYLVALHGAGLTNVIYREGQPLSVLELYAANYQTGDFRRLCEDYSYTWYGLAGEPTRGGDPQHSDFVIDADEFEVRIADMLRSS